MIKTLTLTACLCFAQVAGTNPQEVVTITGPPTCARCTVDLELEVTLVDRPDLEWAIVGGTRHVVRDSAGRILLTHNLDPAHIFQFAADGTFIQVVGTEGQGPGDFTIAGQLILGEQGELYVFDRVQRRMTVFSSDLELLDTELLPVPPREALFVPDGLVVAGHAYSPDMIGLPMHFLTRRFELSRSFGTNDETARPDMTIVHLRSLARGTDGMVWASRVNRYLIEEWDPATGTRGRAFERRPDWFAPWFVSRSLSLVSPPDSLFQEIWQDDRGLLWTISAVGAESWTDGLRKAPDTNRVELYDLERLYDSVIEVIDPSSGALLVSVRVPQFLMGFTNDGLMIGYREPDDDVAYLKLWRAKLIR